MKGRLKNLLFDLDGTLTDPAVGIYQAYDYAMAKMGKAPLGLLGLLGSEQRGLQKQQGQQGQVIGPPIRQVFTTLCGIEPGQVETAVAYYRDYYGERGIFENTVYDGIRELLGDLQAAGYRLFLATSKPWEYAVRILDHFNLSSYFTAIDGSEMTGERSDKAELIAWILERYNLQAEQSMMIGDRSYDVRGAQANNLGSIGVGWGHGSYAELAAAEVTVYVPTILELREQLI